METTVLPRRPQMTIWRMHIACWMLKANNTRSKHVILIAFSWQQWLHESASLFCYSTLPVLSVLKMDVAVHQHGNMKHQFTVHYEAIFWCLFNDTASSSEYMALNGSVVNE
jgi:hypothetical protein